MSKKRWILIVLAVILLTVCLQRLPMLRALENYLYDLRARLLAIRQTVSPEIILIAIDEQSLSALQPAVGRWPWPRAVLASVIDYCSEAKVIALDILLPEGDWQYHASDQMLVEVAQNYGRLVHAIHFNVHPPARALPSSLTRFALKDAPQSWSPRKEYSSILMPYGDLLAASAGVGHVNLVQEEDSVSQMHALVAKGQGMIFPSLALATALQ